MYNFFERLRQIFLRLRFKNQKVENGITEHMSGHAIHGMSMTRSWRSHVRTWCEKHTWRRRTRASSSRYSMLLSMAATDTRTKVPACFLNREFRISVNFPLRSRTTFTNAKLLWHPYVFSLKRILFCETPQFMKCQHFLYSNGATARDAKMHFMNCPRAWQLPVSLVPQADDESATSFGYRLVDSRLRWSWSAAATVEPHRQKQ